MGGQRADHEFSAGRERQLREVAASGKKFANEVMEANVFLQAVMQS